MPIRKIGVVSRTYRHVNRYRQIVTVLIRYGFGEVVDRMRIGHYLEVGLQLLSRQPREQVETLTTAERVRLALEELGPTFIKLGQVLSTRPDLVPADFITELSKLRQRVPPFAFEQVREIVQTELEAPLDAHFEHFERESLAAASIGQVHRARLRSGAEVVVKVQRPGIQSVIEVDLEILLHLATLAEQHIEGLALQRPSRIVEEFARVIERELDFTAEAAHIERFAGLLRDDPTIYVPDVHRDLTTPTVLTMEYVNVVPVTDATALQAAGFDTKLIAARGTQLTLKQLFVLGFFHADPHPGNVFVLPGNVICLLDFGMMGRLDRQGRENFADLLYAVASRDPVAAAAALLHLTEHDDDVDVDPRRLERDVAEFIDVNVTAELRELNFGKLVENLIALVTRHKLRIPPDLVTMMKAAATVETIVTQLDPQLNILAAATPYIRRLKLDRMRPKRIFREVLDSGGQLVEMLRDLPGTLRDLLRLAKRGNLRMGFEHRGLEHLQETFERVANRVAFAIVVAALIVGSSLIFHARLPPLWNGVPVIGLIGYLAAGVMGFALLLAILRHGRM